VSDSIDLIPRTRRGWVALVIIAVVTAVAFMLVTRFYDVEGGSRVTGGLEATSAPGLVVTVEPVAVDALRDDATVHFTFDTQGSDLLDSDERLTQNTRITIGSSSGLSEVRFPAGTVLGQYEATIGLDGEQADYPFDVHTGFVTVAADTYAKASDGSLESTGAIPVGLQGRGGVNGWDATLEMPTEMMDGSFTEMTFQRAFSTQVFALLILVLGVVLAALALVVGLLVHSRRKKAEAALLSWTAALLFALPALRNYMPNAPPIGASIDVYVYLWVMVAAVVAAGLVTVSWIVQGGRPDPVQRVAPGENDPHAT
jgi:Domain of unknown function (DUF4436)